MDNFIIKQGATQPTLVMAVNKDNVFLYEKFQKALTNCSVSFSMYDIENNVFKITQQSGGLIIKNNCTTCTLPDNEYLIYYKFTQKDTNKPGRYRAEFKIDFFATESTDITGVFLAPVHDELYIDVVKSLFTDFNSNNKIIGRVFSDQFSTEFS